MSLAAVRNKLQRLEDTICILLMERAQYKQNSAAYTDTFFQTFFQQMEQVYLNHGRYTDAEEYPYFVADPKQSFNLNSKILQAYMTLLPHLCAEGDDAQYGSSVENDIFCLQALSRRIHIGKQVAQIKYQEDSVGYDTLIEKQDIVGITTKLRNIAVEEKNLHRVREKAAHYKLPPDLIADFFKEVVMPLTIEVEVQYFLEQQTRDTVS